jgi:predicted anti-sigma-YlaC factor YlaD
MNCKDVKENLIELVPAGSESEHAADPALLAHVKECQACSGELESLRSTMAMLDEWEAPEPSPYFLSKLQANVRAETQRQPAGWFAWLRRPVMAASLATLLIAGGISIPLLRNRVIQEQGQTVAGTAVGDLESLDRNHDLLDSTDLLDEISGGPSDDVSDTDI